MEPSALKVKEPEDELAAQITELSKCPEGVPEELWALTLKRMDDYIRDFEAGLEDHIREYDRAVVR